MRESEIQNAILHELGREPDLTLWRNNTGTMRQELATRAHMLRMISLIEAGDAHRAADLIRSLLAEPQRFIRFGLCVGSSDIIGVVTGKDRECPLCTAGFPSHGSRYYHYPTQELGMIPITRCKATIGVMIALEVKQIGKNPTKEQILFLNLVNARGGVGMVVRSVDDARQAISMARRLAE